MLFYNFVRDLNTDIRERDKGNLTVFARHLKGKNEIIKCYDSNKFQRLKAIQTP